MGKARSKTLTKTNFKKKKKKKICLVSSPYTDPNALSQGNAWLCPYRKYFGASWFWNVWLLHILYSVPPLEAYLCTGGPSPGGEMIILRNKSHGEILKVWMGIFSTALRNKKYGQILDKNTSPYFHRASLVIWPLAMLKKPILASYPYLGLLRR